MYRMAMIINGVVDNISLWDKVTPWIPDPMYTAVVDVTNTNVDIGWTTTDNVNFTPPTAD